MRVSRQNINKTVMGNRWCTFYQFVTLFAICCGIAAKSVFFSLIFGTSHCMFMVDQARCQENCACIVPETAVIVKILRLNCRLAGNLYFVPIGFLIRLVYILQRSAYKLQLKLPLFNRLQDKDLNIRAIKAQPVTRNNLSFARHQPPHKQSSVAQKLKLQASNVCSRNVSFDLLCQVTCISNAKLYVVIAVPSSSPCYFILFSKIGGNHSLR